jgi:hypothetical protein
MSALIGIIISSSFVAILKTAKTYAIGSNTNFVYEVKKIPLSIIKETGKEMEKILRK